MSAQPKKDVAATAEPTALWAVSRIVLDITDGTIPSLPPRIEPIESASFYAAREQASALLHVPVGCIELVRVR